MQSKRIEARYEVHFLEIGVDKDHVHMMVQSSLGFMRRNWVQLSNTEREVFSDLQLHQSAELRLCNALQ